MNSSAKSTHLLTICLFVIGFSGITSKLFCQQKPDSVNSLTIYLTFDDGPIDVSTQLDSIVRADSVPVTVFLVGERYLKRLLPDTLLSNYRNNPLVEIQNHSYSHAANHYRQFYKICDTVVADLLLNEQILGRHDKIIRLPGRNVWRLGKRKQTDLQDASVAADSLHRLGFSVIGWDLLWAFDPVSRHYQKAQNIMRMVSQTRTFSKGHLVLLCHDWMFEDPLFRDELSEFIRLVRGTRGYRFALISHYPGAIASRSD